MPYFNVPMDDSIGMEEIDSLDDLHENCFNRIDGHETVLVNELKQITSILKIIHENCRFLCVCFNLEGFLNEIAAYFIIAKEIVKFNFVQFISVNHFDDYKFVCFESSYRFIN